MLKTRQVEPGALNFVCAPGHRVKNIFLYTFGHQNVKNPAG